MGCHEVQDEVETGTVASVSEAEDPESSEAETPLLELMEQGSSPLESTMVSGEPEVASFHRLGAVDALRRQEFLSEEVQRVALTVELLRR